MVDVIMIILQWFVYFMVLPSLSPLSLLDYFNPQHMREGYDGCSLCEWVSESVSVTTLPATYLVFCLEYVGVIRLLAAFWLYVLYVFGL